MRRNPLFVASIALTIALGALVAAGRGRDHAVPPPAAAAPDDPAMRWGVALQGVRLSAAGHVLDFRYRVLDADKALPLVDRTKKAFLMHEPSGAALGVIEAPMIGPLRQTEKFGKPQEGRIYTVLFGNAGMLVKEGDRVQVAIGEFRSPEIVVH
jgi:hypothetical protein